MSKTMPVPRSREDIPDDTDGSPKLTPDEADAFAAVWNVLARVLEHPPTAETLDKLRTHELLQDWPLRRMGSSDDMEIGLACLAESRSEDATVVADDHMRLLRGPSRALASPYESVHRSREGLVFESETMQVRLWYARFGLQVSRLNRDPDDQIHTELDFCSTLLNRGLRALDGGDDAQCQMLFAAHRDFCREHLLTWAPAFFDLVLEHANTSFYRGVALLGRDALARVEELQVPRTTSAE